MSPATDSTGKSMRQMVTVLGKLDAIEHGSRQFTLLLDDGQRVRCVLAAGDIAALGPLFGKRVLVGGMGVWHPSGRLDRIETERVDPGEDEPPVWSVLPRPLGFLSEVPLEDPTPRPWGWAAMIGKWPGDETDEQIEEALRRLR